MKLHEAGRILHPTDFSRGSEAAFAHALKLALVTKAELEILHVDRHPEQVPWIAFPGVRETLIRWKVLHPSASEAEVAKLGISVYKATVGGSNPLNSILEHIEHRPAGLIVLASHHPTGLDRLLHRDAANHFARLAKTTALFVPHGSSGFVNADNGDIAMGQILIPFDIEPPPQPAVDTVQELIALLQVEQVSCHLLHVGQEDLPWSAPHISAQSNTHWETIFIEGEVISGIRGFAEDHQVKLIALATHGHYGFLDILRGSTADQLLRAARCPILAVPSLAVEP